MKFEKLKGDLSIALIVILFRMFLETPRARRSLKERGPTPPSTRLSPPLRWQSRRQLRTFPLCSQLDWHCLYNNYFFSRKQCPVPAKRKPPAHRWPSPDLQGLPSRCPAALEYKYSSSTQGDSLFKASARHRTTTSCLFPPQPWIIWAAVSVIEHPARHLGTPPSGLSLLYIICYTYF